MKKHDRITARVAADIPKLVKKIAASLRSTQTYAIETAIREKAERLDAK